MSAAPLTYQLSWKSTLAASWTDCDVDVLKVEYRLAPGSSLCAFRHRFGVINDIGYAGAGERIVTPVDFRGKWIRVALTDGAETGYWYGYCPAEEAEIDRAATYRGTAFSTGDSLFTAYGLEYFLKQHAYRFSYIDRGGALVRLERGLDFNDTGTSRGVSVLGTRGPTAYSGVYGHHDTGDTKWTGLTALRHVLHCVEQDLGIAFTLTGQYASLDNVTEAWSNLDGRSYYEVIANLVKPSRGFTFFVHGQQIEVKSITDTDIGSPVVVPANSEVVNLTLDSSALIRRAVVRHLDSVHYDRIVVQGEYARACFSVSTTWSTLEAGWSSAEETAYNAASDRERRMDAHRKVYCRYHVPASWDGKILGTAVVPKIDTDTGQPDWTQAQTMYPRRTVLDRTLPILDDDTNQPIPAKVWVKAGGVYHLADNPEDASLSAISVYVLDDRLGLQLHPRYPHYMGLTHFSGSSAGAAMLDWDEVVATVSMYTDERVRVEVDAVDAEPGEITKTKTITVPGCHLWVIAQGTLLDYDDTGWSTQATDEVLRDDTERLVTVAELARAWYGRRRCEIEVTYGEMFAFWRLGQVIKEVSAHGTTIPAGTVISRVTFNFADLTQSFSTEWRDVDLGALYRTIDSRGEVAAVGRRTAHETACVPARPASGGGGGSGAGVLVKITGVHPSSPTGAGDVRMFRGSVYANGSGEAATATLVTIRIAGLAANIGSYPDGYLFAVPITETWVNASSVSVTETVYEVAPWLWWGGA